MNELAKTAAINYKAQLTEQGIIAPCKGAMEYLSGTSFYAKYPRRTKRGVKYLVFMVDHRYRVAYKEYSDAKFINVMRVMDAELQLEHHVKHQESLQLEAARQAVTA